MATTLKDLIADQVHPEWEDNQANFKLWRAAAKAELDGGSVVEQDLNSKEPPVVQTKDGRSYVYRFSKLETDANFNSRHLFAHDFGYTPFINESFVGTLLKPVRDVDFSINKALDQKIRTNIDNQSSTLQAFEQKVDEELFDMGKVWVVTDASSDDAADTVSYIVPREDMIDWDFDDDGKLIYAKWDTADFERESADTIGTAIDAEGNTVEVSIPKLEKNLVHKRILLTRDFWFICVMDGEKVSSVEIRDNKVKEVTVRVKGLGSKATPLTKKISILSIDLMNLTSEERQILRLQALAIWEGPTEARNQLSEGLSATSMILLSPEAREIACRQYEASSLDGHRNYRNDLIDITFELARQKRVSQKGNRSGVAESFDFLDTESALEFAAGAIESIMAEIIADHALFRGKKDLQVTYRIPRNFNKAELDRLMKVAMEALAMQVGATAEAKIREGVRDLTIEALGKELDSDEVVLSDKEIAAINGELIDDNDIDSDQVQEDLDEEE